MIPARAAPAGRIVRANIQNRLIIPRCASAPAAFCLSDEWDARFDGPRVCVNMVMSKNLSLQVVRGGRALPLLSKLAIGSIHR